MRAFKCDKCGKYYDKRKSSSYNYRLSKLGSQLVDVDLCPNCTDELDQWMQDEIQMIVYRDKEAAGDGADEHI